jgi:hypothetical protein
MLPHIKQKLKNSRRPVVDDEPKPVKEESESPAKGTDVPSKTKNVKTQFKSPHKQ